MMNTFTMNGYLWRIKEVDPYDTVLIDREGKLTLGITDPYRGYVYLANNLSKDMRNRVLVHELGHCALVSFGLLDQIRQVITPEKWIPVEEWVCNLFADYGLDIYKIASAYLGEDAWMAVPYGFEKIIK